jgi:hypothetical protein
MRYPPAATRAHRYWGGVSYDSPTPEVLRPQSCIVVCPQILQEF